MSNSENEPSVVSAAAFDACDIEAPIAALVRFDWHVISLAYQQAVPSAIPPCLSVYALIGEIMGIHLDPASRGSPWGPWIAGGDRRSMIPSDLRGQQNDELASIISKLKNPFIKARIADVVWTNDRRNRCNRPIATAPYAP
jgi:hypothetical protein